ncbi:uncharacterized protein EAE98_011152 [Botrytis deweyae]|uniref:Uncharacterized protein n=2 Tax=Botrytis TaxID=33196 RepID=A0A4Z1JN16_9HELO|nr:uncharacterized protein EAE98_011152 [Botrytis deweyae]KAF7915549.1 hypothetical protein EAE98_011152 [Botrytis deweyae]KAF7921867.1 hypothetical protein EAE99_007630 [Botrytis elliptica]TGO74856.1 hypothetical protein BELL_0252g00200 [Botrytis elliptica]
MLLTSGQVSVAISSFIVFFFTTALFLSGYVLQQQTVRDLREAIKPQFQAKLVGLEVPDNLNINADRSGRKGQVEVFLPKKFENEAVRKGNIRAEIKRDVEEEIDEVAGKNGKNKKTRGEGNEEWSGAGLEESVTEVRKDYGSIEGEGDGAGSADNTEGIKKGGREEIAVPEKPLSRAERRRRIKEELVTSGEGETFNGYRRRVPGA